MSEPFEDSRRLTGCNFYFSGTGAALETARGLAFDDDALARWRNHVASARRALGWPDAETIVRKHRSGASLAFAAPSDQLYAATEINEWAWWSAVAFPFSPREKVPKGRMRERSALPFSLREKVPEGRMRERHISDLGTSPKKIPFDQESQSFIRNLRRASTDAEHLIWSHLRGRRMHGQKFRRQQPVGPYALDFYCHDVKLAIELDGGQHNEAEQSAHDAMRDAFMVEHGIRTLRYWNDDVLERTDDVLAEIWRSVEELIDGNVSGAAIGQDAPSSALRAPSPGGRRGEQDAPSSALRAPSPRGRRGEQDVPSSALRAPSPGGRRGEQGVFHAPGHAAIWDRDLALQTLKAFACAEARPALVALQREANARALPFLPDDNEVSVGAGDGSRTWPVDALPSPPAVDWSALHAIPTALVTGSNGKTTTVRLLAAMTRAQGWHTAHSCTDGVFFDGEPLESGDFSGPTGTRTALRQPRAQAAILEIARGGLLRRGLAICRAHVAVVTNISADHFGEYGIHDLDDLTAVKLSVAQAIGADALLVLNADDPVLVRRSQALSCPTGWFALDFDLASLAAHRERGGATCGVRAGRLLLSGDGAVQDLGEIATMPLTLSARAAYNIANIAAAALAAPALGIASETIARVLSRFGAAPADNPGRLQHWRFGGLQVYVDYAHNPEGLHGLLQATGARGRKGRLAIILGHAGNREDDDLRAVAAAAAAFAPELVVLKDIGGYERGRADGEVAAIMQAQLRAAGLPADAIETQLDEVAAARRPLEWARDGDLVVLPVHELAARAEVVALLDTLQSQHWQPGAPLPEREGARE